MLLGVFLPFFHWITLVLFSRKLGKLGVIYLTIFSCCLTVSINVFNFYTVNFTPVTYFFNLGPWMQVGLLDVEWEFMLDFLSTSMIGMVSIISAVVHIYSFSYMKTDPHFLRFISYLSLSTFFMFILVSAANFLVFFVGWEGVGICSYILINFWYTRGQANKAALKALLMNRVGDVGFLLGVVLLFSITGSVDFSSLEIYIPILDFIFDVSYNKPGWFFRRLSMVDMACLCFFVGAIAKSAQIGLHTWLPAAMEGPTPVSALIHAATMVTAGIFLLIRCSWLFQCSWDIQELIIVVGAVTAFCAAITAIFLFDIKKIIAYSTCSQLGYMAVACGFGQWTLGLFHLINHAFFKALLFLTAGAIIHSFNNEQDIRKLSNLTERMPFLHVCMVVGSVAIMGLPFLSGFYSKDIIIEIIYARSGYHTSSFEIVPILMMIATICTGIYSFRLYYFLFLRQGTNFRNERNEHFFEQPFFIQIAISCLLIGSIFSGYFLNEIFFIGNNWSVLKNDYCPTCYLQDIHTSFQENEWLPGADKILPFIFNILVLTGGFFVVQLLQKTHCTLKVVHWLWVGLFYNSLSSFYLRRMDEYFMLNKMTGNVWWIRFYDWTMWVFKYYLTVSKAVYTNFYFNELYNYFAVLQFKYYYSIIFINLDKGGFEIFGPKGLERLYKKSISGLRWYYNRHFGYFLTIVYYTILISLFLIEIF